MMQTHVPHPTAAVYIEAVEGIGSNASQQREWLPKPIKWLMMDAHPVILGKINREHSNRTRKRMP